VYELSWQLSACTHHGCAGSVTSRVRPKSNELWSDYWPGALACALRYFITLGQASGEGQNRGHAP